MSSCLDFVRNEPGLDDYTCAQLICADNCPVYDETTLPSILSALVDRDFQLSISFLLRRFTLSDAEESFKQEVLLRAVEHGKSIGVRTLTSFLYQHYEKAAWFEEAAVWTQLIELCAKHGLKEVLLDLKQRNPGNHPFPAFKALTSAVQGTNNLATLRWLLTLGDEEVQWSERITQEACVIAAANGQLDALVLLYDRFQPGWTEGLKQQTEINILRFACWRRHSKVVEWCMEREFEVRTEMLNSLLGAAQPNDNVHRWWTRWCTVVDGQALALMSTHRSFFELFREAWRSSERDLKALLLAVAQLDNRGNDFSLLLELMDESNLELSADEMSAILQSLVENTADNDVFYFSTLLARDSAARRCFHLFESWKRKTLEMQKFGLWLLICRKGSSYTDFAG